MNRLSDIAAVLPGRRQEADEFAALLDASRVRSDHELAPLATLARSLAPAEQTPAADFRDALRARLLAEAAARPATLPVQRPATPEAPPDRTTRWRPAVASVVVATALAGAGAATASTQALPGDALYGLKLRMEAGQLLLSGSDLERGRELFQQASERLDEAESLSRERATGGDVELAEIRATLLRMQEATAEGAEVLTDSYDETGDPEPMEILDRFAEDQQVRLQELSQVVDPSLLPLVWSSTLALDDLERVARSVLGPAPPGRTWEANGLPAPAREGGGAIGRQAVGGALPPSAGDRTEPSARPSNDEDATARGSDPAREDPTRPASENVAGALDDTQKLADSATPSLPTATLPLPTATLLPADPAEPPTAVTVPPIPTPLPTPTLGTGTDGTAVCGPVPPLPAC